MGARVTSHRRFKEYQTLTGLTFAMTRAMAGHEFHRPTSNERRAKRLWDNKQRATREATEAETVESRVVGSPSRTTRRGRCGGGA